MRHTLMLSTATAYASSLKYRCFLVDQGFRCAVNCTMRDDTVTLSCVFILLLHTYAPGINSSLHLCTHFICKFAISGI
jgi:hypothetical protein